MTRSRPIPYTPITVTPIRAVYTLREELELSRGGTTDCSSYDIAPAKPLNLAEVHAALAVAHAELATALRVRDAKWEAKCWEDIGQLERLVPRLAKAKLWAETLREVGS